MAQAHTSEEWSDPRSNPLELSSSLRSKRLTEGYYASLALVFKLIRRFLRFQYVVNLGEQCFLWCLRIFTAIPEATVTVNGTSEFCRLIFG